MEWTSIQDSAYDADITYTVGTQTCTIQIQLKDFAGKDLTVKGVIHFYISTDATGDALDAVASIASGDDGDILEVLATGQYYMAISEDDGDIDLTVTADANETRYLNVVLPNGKVVHSDAMVFTTF